MKYPWASIPLLLIAGCFGLRSPEEPGESAFWQYPDAPHKVLDNIRFAYLYRSIENVENSLDSASFVFVADPSLLAGPKGYLYLNWDYEKEVLRTKEYFQLLDLTDPLPVSLSFSEDSVDSQPHVVRFRIFYTFSSKLADGRVLNAHGTSTFRIEEDPSGLWYLTSWEDFKDDTFLSWGEVKAGDY